MFGRCTTDSVTELKQRCDSVRLLFLNYQISLVYTQSHSFTGGFYIFYPKYLYIRKIYYLYSIIKN